MNGSLPSTLHTRTERVEQLIKGAMTGLTHPRVHVELLHSNPAAWPGDADHLLDDGLRRGVVDQYESFVHPVEPVAGKAGVGCVGCDQRDVGQLALGDRPLGMSEHPRLVVQADDLARRADVSAENVEHPKRAAADIQHTGSVSDVDPVQEPLCLAAVQFTLSEQPRSLTFIGAERVLMGNGVWHC